MIKLRKKAKNLSTDGADYVLEKFDKFDDIIAMLTPKFDGNWNIVMIDPKLKMINDLITIKRIPEWVDLLIYTSDKKIEEIALNHPEYQPKEMTVKERFDELIAKIETVITSDASKSLLTMYRQQPDEVEDVLHRLDKDPSVERITKKELAQNIVYVKRTYVSDVLLAFITQDPRRWDLYNKVHAELGTEIMYYAMYKYVKKLLREKADYLQNKDVTIYAVRQIDAATIDYVYLLFANSHHSSQLTALLHAIENRCEKMLNMFISE